LVISYYQPRDTSREGIVVLDGEIFRTTGRLDVVGSRVFAWGAARRRAGPEPGAEAGSGSDDIRDIRLTIQCERTSETTLAAEITVFGRGGTVILEHRTDGVPLLVT